MTDALIRMECPACLGVPMDKAAVQPDLAIDHCGRCGGNWIVIFVTRLPLCCYPYCCCGLFWRRWCRPCR